MFGTASLRLRLMTGLTPLVSQPVILRVVRVIERVKEGLETSDGGLLRDLVCAHYGGPLLRLAVFAMAISRTRVLVVSVQAPSDPR